MGALIRRVAFPKNRAIILFSACFVVFGLYLGQAEAADVQSISTGHISLEGRIEEGDLRKIYDLRLSSDTIYLDSPGGNVQEALRIGRYFRDHRYRVIIERDAICNSACFLAFIGGVERLAIGGVGLHRPYFDPDDFGELPIGEAERIYNTMMAEVNHYLHDMGAPSNVIEIMTNTRSTDMKHLDIEELDKLGVGTDEVAYHEWWIAKCGDLSDSEWNDYYADLHFRQRKEGGAKLPTGYRNYLRKTGDQIVECRDDARNTEFSATIDRNFALVRSCMRDKNNYEQCTQEVLSQY